jgi:hypothetical protein
MTAVTTFTCDFCPTTVQELIGRTPLGWWEIPRLGPEETPGHACPNCVLGNEDARQSIATRRSEETARLLDEHPPTAERESRGKHHRWPFSRTSPFGGQGD